DGDIVCSRAKNHYDPQGNVDFSDSATQLDSTQAEGALEAYRKSARRRPDVFYALVGVTVHVGVRTFERVCKGSVQRSPPLREPVRWSGSGFAFRGPRTGPNRTSDHEKTSC
ncbi:hypothetical protein P692DRAFT_20749663, partial [Suillus brevipes Sb2]